MTTEIWAEQALTARGWQRNVAISINSAGIVTSIQENQPRGKTCFEIILPAPVNLHSHAFQRAMAGLTESRGPDPRDSFWSWRKLMYRFLDQLQPDDMEAIAAFVQMQMLQAGYAAVGEFHYLHHAQGGVPYSNIAELSDRMFAATITTGIGLTHLPVLYQQGGSDGRALVRGQDRFGNDLERFGRLLDAAQAGMAGLPGDCRLGVAPHSLRAVSREALVAVQHLMPDAPLHMHLAEQLAEVAEVEASWGARPVDWLLDNAEVDARWCLIHCTQMTRQETEALAPTGAVAGLCPITESSLGDGIFDGVRYLDRGGRFGIGSDSNIKISLHEELRTLDYSQRLRDHSRAALATPTRSTGRVLFDGACQGGAQAAGRNAGQIIVGQYADLLELDGSCVDLDGLQGDLILDTWIFAGHKDMVRNVWSAGRHVVQDGAHIRQAQIETAYRAVQNRLRADL
jgi:formimidoylglutamate deiminase